MPCVHDDVVLGIQFNVASGFKFNQFLVCRESEDIVLLFIIIDTDISILTFIMYLDGVTVASSNSLNLVATVVVWKPCAIRVAYTII